MLLTYQDLISYPTYLERVQYLQCNGIVGHDTFGYDRYLNQQLYNCYDWKYIRRQVIIRDNGKDLGCEDRDIVGKIIVHHLNPITVEDVINRNPCVLDMDNLICVSHETHNLIHYGIDTNDISMHVLERTPGDTIPWR